MATDRNPGKPENRQEALRNLVAKQRNPAASGDSDDDRDLLEPLMTPPALLPGSIDQERPAWFDYGDVRCKAKLVLAARRALQARRQADRAALEAGSLPPTLPVRGYPARLAALFVLDFPILTMAFVAAAQASPIVAAGSALALSLFLVLGAHVLGGHLREIARHLPPWCLSAISVVIVGALLACTVAVSIDLRLKGFEIEALIDGLGRGGPVFGNPGNNRLVLPAEIQWAIVRAAALVTIMATVFGIGWSFQHHAPQTAFARAETAYARALEAYAAAARRMAAKSKTYSAAVAALAGLLLPLDAKADSCGDRHVLAFVDTTTAYDDRDRRTIMSAVDQMAASLRPGQRLILRTVRDHPASSRLLLDRCVPEPIGFSWTALGVLDWLVSNPAGARAARERFFADLREALLSALQVRGDAAKTALVGTMVAHGQVVGEIVAIWLFSDLLESDVVPAEELLVRPAALTPLATTLPPLEGVPVHVAGIGRYHDDNRRPLSRRERGRLIDSWSALIAGAGGRLSIID